LNSESKHMTAHNIRITSAEMSSLWASYMMDSLSKCLLGYFLNRVEDTEILPVLEYAYKLTNKHLARVTDIFKHEKFPIPYGFTKEDVNLDAPRLFSAAFYLYYLKNLGRMGVQGSLSTDKQFRLH
jgi:hypothetical protein